MLTRLNDMAAMGHWSKACRAILLALAGLAAIASPATAQGVERLGDFQDWAAFRFTEGGKKACYMASQPTKDEGKYNKRGDIYALVTHRPAEDRRDEVSFIAGYTFKKDSKVEVKIGASSFQLFTSDDGAWTANSDDDGQLVKTMIRGSSMVVRGTSSRGTKTKDTYSLKGFTAAYEKISEVCAAN